MKQNKKYIAVKQNQKTEAELRAFRHHHSIFVHLSISTFIKHLPATFYGPHTLNNSHCLFCLLVTESWKKQVFPEMMK